MHMADALISPQVGAVMFTLAAGATAYSINKIRKEEDFQSKIPLMGVVGAFVFAAQMVNFSIPGTGSSGHIVGGVLLSALLGPEAAFISIVSILIVQCLIFGDGGLLALGCNIINMGFFGCFVGYKLMFNRIVDRGCSKKKLIMASIFASVLGLECGAFLVVLETLASGITRLPFSTFIIFMLSIHLAIGMVEGLVTGLILNFVYENRPDILEKVDRDRKSKFSKKKLITIFLITSIAVSGVMSLFASSNPDGLEWSILQTSGSEELENNNAIQDVAESIQSKIAFLPDYELKNTSNSEVIHTIGCILAGVVGVTVTLVVIVGVGHASKKRKEVNYSKGNGNERP